MFEWFGIVLLFFLKSHRVMVNNWLKAHAVIKKTPGKWILTTELNNLFYYMCSQTGL